MKKLYFTLLTVLLFCLPSLANDVIVKGYVTYSNGTAAANQWVYIQTDSLSTPNGCHQYSQVYTNANGYYIDTLSCSSGNIVKVQIRVSNCNGTLLIENPQVNTTTNIVERNFVLGCNVQQTCVADFNYNVQGSYVTYTSISYTTNNNQITSLYWELGDGATVNGMPQGFVHNYANPGTYTVKLRIETANGCKDSITKVITLTNTSGSCQAQFKDSLIAPNKFIFLSGSSTSAPGTSITNRLWSFGDGSYNSGNNINVDHIYQQPGTYTVCLRIYASTGCVDSICKTITVTSVPTPTCNADFSYQVAANGTVYFNNASTTSAGPNVQYYWHFGDGMTGSAQNAVYTYTTPGTYNVCMAMFANGCMDSICKTVVVNFTPPPPCNANFNYQLGANGNVTFTNTSSTLGTNTQYHWDFGNGIFSTTTNASYQFQPGTYNVCLTIWNNNCADTICKTITIPPPTTTCNANFNFQVGSNGTVSFTNTSTSSSSNVQYYWLFGNGTTSSVKNPTIGYKANGTYNVCLKISSNGCIDSICKTVVITTIPVCTANFSYQVGANGVVNFINTSSTLGTNTQYYWMVGNNTISNTTNASYQFQPGTYNVCLSFWGACHDSICKTIIVPPYQNPTPCEAVFAFTGQQPTPGTNGYTLQFSSANSHATSAAGDSIRERIWIWGDGSTTTGNLVNTSHTYTSAGTYNVCLVIRSQSNCSDTTCKTVTVPMPNQLVCNAQFSYENLPYTTPPNRTVKFNATASGTVNGDSIISYKWQFGNGTTLTTTNKIVTTNYTQPGTYTVCLSITTALGCTRTECKVIVVTQSSSACVPHFTWTKTGTKQISFNSSMSWVPVNDTIISRTWNFGNATPLLTGNVINPVHNYQYNGVYTVSLKIKTIKNCEQTVYIPVNVQDSMVNPPNVEPVKIISIYPTPAQSQTQAVVWSQHNNVQAELAIFDVYGQKKWSLTKYLMQGNNITVLPTAFLLPGPYYFRVTTVYGIKSKAFFKN